MAALIRGAEQPASTGWRFKLGIAMVALAIALWLLILLAGVLGVSAARIAAMTGIVFIANKVLLLACIAVMGKTGFQQLKGIIFGHFKTLAPSDTVGPTRHAVGLAMFCLPLLSSMLEPYVDHLWPGLRPNRWELQALGDVMLVASFFVLGGDFWNKVRALFIRTVRDEDVSASQALPSQALPR